MTNDHSPVPGNVKELLENRGLNGVPVLLSTSTDLGLKGTPRKEWVVITKDNVSVVADRTAPELVTNVPLSRVERFRSVNQYPFGRCLDVMDDHGFTMLARVRAGSR